MKKLILACALGTSLALSGCQTGNAMNYNQIASQIQRGVTTEQQVRAMFGEPVEVRTDSKLNVRILVYKYGNSDELKKVGAGLVGAAIGGVLGHQIGGGSGKSVATSIGATAGAALASNAVTTREHTQKLSVIISLSTGLVEDYRFEEEGSRSQVVRPSSGPASL